MLGFLKARREKFLTDQPDFTHWTQRFYSATTYALWRSAEPLMDEYCRGRVLDAGCGYGGWRAAISQTAGEYKSLDVEPRGAAAPTYIGDIMAMPQVPSDHFDTVVCHQVLEHVPRPWDAMAEFHRLLLPGGRLLLSVPHLSRRHELPHDYFRFTQDGVRALCEGAGLEIVELQAYGGLFSFLHHQVSFFINGIFGMLPLVGSLFMFLNAGLSIFFRFLDSLIDRAHLYPSGVIVVARAAKTQD